MELRQCSSAALFFNHDMLLLIFWAKLKGDCEILQWGPPPTKPSVASSPKQSTHLCVLHFRQFRITGSDLNWGIAAVIGELDHGDAVQTFPARRFKLRIGLREREGMAYIRSNQEFLPNAHEAIPRGYSEQTVLKEGMFEDLSLANKQLRFVLIFLMVCLLLNWREMVGQLLNQLKVLVDECKRTFQLCRLCLCWDNIFHLLFALG